jgi:hypothetical protein
MGLPTGGSLNAAKFGPCARSRGQFDPRHSGAVHRLVGVDAIGKRSRHLEPELGHGVEQAAKSRRRS